MFNPFCVTGIVWFCGSVCRRADIGVSFLVFPFSKTVVVNESKHMFRQKQIGSDSINQMM